MYRCGSFCVLEVNDLECENKFCVYMKNGKCILEKISLDICGLCKSCVYVNIKDKTLDAYKS